MTIQIDPALATAVSQNVGKTADDIISSHFPTPSGFDWSDGSAATAQWVLNQVLGLVATGTRSISTNTADCAKGFQVTDEVGRGMFRNGWGVH